MIGYVVCALIALFASFIWHRYRLMTLRERLGIPGPKANFFFGNVFDLRDCFEKHRETNPLFLKWKKEYGNTFGVYFGPRLFVVVNDLDMARDILVKQFSYFEDRPGIPFMAHEPMCDIIPNVNGEKWKKNRNFLTPTFTTAKLRQMGDVMDEKIAVFMQLMDENAKSGKVFDIYHRLQGLTLDIIGKCAFAMDVKSQTDRNDPFLKHTQTFMEELSMQKSTWLLLCFLFPELDYFISYFRPISKTGIAESWLFRNLRNVIAARKKTLQNFKSVDVLQVLLEQNEQNKLDSKKDSVISDGLLESNIFTFLVAGYETTSTALSYTLWFLSKYKNVQKKLQDEIDEKLNSMKNLNDTVNYETIHKMAYLDSVLKEAMRYYPPVTGFITRKCGQDCVINGVTFEKGMRAMFLPRLIHFDPDVWQEPYEFNPDRFINSKEHHPMAWLPFGTGPRNCIGMRFADTAAKLTLFRLLSKYNIEMGPGSEDPLIIQESDLVMRPLNGVFVKLVKRV